MRACRKTDPHNMDYSVQKHGCKAGLDFSGLASIADLIFHAFSQLGS